MSGFDKKWLSVSAFAEREGVSRQYVDQLIRSRKLPFAVRLQGKRKLRFISTKLALQKIRVHKQI